LIDPVARIVRKIDPAVEQWRQPANNELQRLQAKPRFDAIETEDILMQRVIAVLERPAQGDRRVELHKFGLQLLVDEQQRLQRTVDVAVATGHDFVDRGVILPGSHRKSSNCPSK
jgi:vacuolar-type H+-ATPase subunit E/Vma4